MTAARTDFSRRTTSMEQIERLLVEFMTAPVERIIYNEFSLQFELGIFFRDNGFNVFFERNVNTFDNLHVPDGESPIYSYFRNGKTVEAGEVIEKPTGTKGSPVRMGRSHRIEWKQSAAPWNFLKKKRSEDCLHYYIVSS